jgi:hypothetical protein
LATENLAWPILAVSYSTLLSLTLLLVNLNNYFNLGRGKQGENYMKRSFVLGCLMALGLALPTQATVYFNDEFAYADGQLTSTDSTSFDGTGTDVSGGLWNGHSGMAEFVEVLDGKAVVKNSGTEDVNRQAGTSMTAFGGETWYYAARFTATDNRPEFGAGAIGLNHFLHFIDNGTFNLTARLWTMPPNVSDNGKFTLGLSSYSVNTNDPLSGQRKWAEDLEFGQEYTVVVSFKGIDSDIGSTDDGFSTFWINPTNSASTSLTDNHPHSDLFLNSTDPADVDADRSNMSGLALRQANAGNNQPSFLFDEVAVGTSFDEVLAAVSVAPPGTPGDFDDDDDVDGRDFLIWQRGGSPGGVGDADDLADWQEFYGTQPPLTAVTAVPEPASLAMLALALVPVAFGRKR